MGMIVILFGVLVFKGAVVSFLVPIASAPLEVYHYRMADRHRVAGQLPGGSTGVISKELSHVIRYFQRDGDRIGQRTQHDRRKLTADLNKSGTRALVTTSSYLPSIDQSPGYYLLLRSILDSLRGMEIRWRWFILRIFHLLSMTLACMIIVHVAFRMGVTDRSAALWAGFVFVSGPGFGLDGSLLGPHSVLVFLWAFFIWRLVAFLRSSAVVDAAMAALTAFVMSSIHIHGFFAFIVAAIVLSIGIARARGRSRIFLILPLIFVISGITSWVLRDISQQGVIAEEYRNTNTAVMQIFSRSTWNTAPADILSYVWGCMTLMGLAGIFILVRRNQIKQPAVFIPILSVFVAGLFGIAFPDIFMAWGSLSPLFALIMGAGFSVLSIRYRVVWIVLIIMVCIDLLDLIYQVVRMYS